MLNRFTQNDPCSRLGIPKHLHTANRQKVSEFAPSETIYRRFTEPGTINQWKGNNQVSASIFKLDNDSCNRSIFCQLPEDVLLNTREQDNGAHYLTHGIISFNVGKFYSLLVPPAPAIKQNGFDRNFVLHLEHDPLPCMYPHTEIHVYDGSNRIDNSPPKSTKAIIRGLLLDICEIVKMPGQ